jgi:hypothetical protein
MPTALGRGRPCPRPSRCSSSASATEAAGTGRNTASAAPADSARAPCPQPSSPRCLHGHGRVSGPVRRPMTNLAQTARVTGKAPRSARTRGGRGESAVGARRRQRVAPSAGTVPGSNIRFSPPARWSRRRYELPTGAGAHRVLRGVASAAGCAAVQAGPLACPPHHGRAAHDAARMFGLVPHDHHRPPPERVPNEGRRKCSTDVRGRAGMCPRGACVKGRPWRGSHRA